MDDLKKKQYGTSSILCPAGVTVRKRSIRVEIGNFLSAVTLKFDRWLWKTIGHFSYAASSFVYHFIAIGEFKLELQSGSTRFGSKSMIFSCDQAAYRTLLSVCLSVRPSVTPFSLCSHHRIITKFSGVFTIGRRDVHAKGQRSKVKVARDKKSPILTQIGRFRTVTPVWIYQWLRNDAQSLK